MDIQKIQQYKSTFDAITKSVNDDDGNTIEVWYARELQEVLGYARWENFVGAIGRAMESCKTLGINIDDHFREVTKMIALAKGARRDIQDFMLTRYACYLIAQNGDPKKEEIAFAQSYFAVQTRKAELIEERLNEFARLSTRERLRASEKQLSRNIYERGVDDKGFGRIRSKSIRTLPEGAINGLFTINANGDKVYFSKGNLQYIGSVAIPFWKFADNQWEYLGTTFGQNSSDENIDRDLFGWGTSGNNHGAVCYQPWSTSNQNSDYYAYGFNTYSLFDQTGQADWGYNAIFNGGNIENLWRTLNKDEWAYLFNSRNTTSGIRFVKAKVNGRNGIIVLPDDWDILNYVLNIANLLSGCSYEDNTISASNWDNKFENNGAVFLPCGGWRSGINVNSVGVVGDYWTSTSEGSNVYELEFTNNLIPHTQSRHYGFSVRLVKDY